MSSERQVRKLSDIALVNPKESIPHGEVAKKVPMEKLRPFSRDVNEFVLEKFSGGAKFKNGDTIMARITPCLENGKTAKINFLDNDEVGFGSTEYIVFRAVEGQCDEDYLYYLITSPIVREPAIKSMVGSSGRQRVQTDVIQNLKILVPSFGDQQTIGRILRSIDDKIAVNDKINQNLEQQTQAIFKEKFINNYDDTWQHGTFSNIINYMINGDWGKEKLTGNYTEKVFCIRGADIPEVRNGNKGKMPIRYILPKNYLAKHLVPGDIVVEVSGGSPTQSTGRATIITDSLLNRYDRGMVCTNFCKALKPYEGYSLFAYHYWQYLYDQGIFFSYENGTTGIKNLDIAGIIENEPIIIPPKEFIVEFNNTCNTFYNKIYANSHESEQLAQLRDTLLPKLLSGELDVSSIDI